MQSLHEAPVAEDEIDELGHFSAPFYDRRAYIASAAIAAQLGMNAEVLAGQQLELVVSDAYRRNIAEQFLGAELRVTGGIIDATSERLRCYHELHNVNDGVLSATFVHELVLRRLDDHAIQPWPAEVVERANELTVEWPEAARGRSIDLTGKPVLPSYEEVQAKNLAYTLPHTISADECDGNERFLTEVYQGLPYSGESIDADASEWIVTTEDGRRLGLADLETRNVYHVIPKAGTTYQVFSAPTALAGKTYRRHYWAFDVADGTLLATYVVVVIMLDLDARRSAEIPPAQRHLLESQLSEAMGANT